MNYRINSQRFADQSPTDEKVLIAPVVQRCLIKYSKKAKSKSVANTDNQERAGAERRTAFSNHFGNVVRHQSRANRIGHPVARFFFRGIYFPPMTKTRVDETLV